MQCFILQTPMVEAKKNDESSSTHESADVPKSRNKTTLMALITMESETEECDAKIIGKLSITNKICCNI